MTRFTWWPSGLVCKMAAASFHYDGSSWNYRPDTDFPMTSLRAVMVDNEGTVWIGLGDTGLGGGIFRIVP